MIAGSVAIVTGPGGTGYGRAIAQRFARDRTAVVVSDINEQVEARPTVQLIQVTGGHSV